MAEALRYWQNARAILKQSKIEENIYSDVKYVKSACGIAYLGVLKAIDESLTKRGVPSRDLPKTAASYRKALQKHLAVHNGKLLRAFDALYHELHIAGYYRGDLQSVETVKSALRLARTFIESVR